MFNYYFYRNFQLFFAQRMLHDDSPTKRKAASALAETRMALTSLKSFKRRNIAAVPVERVGENIRSVVPGVVRQQHHGYDNRMANSNVMINVYEVCNSIKDTIFYFYKKNDNQIFQLITILLSLNVLIVQCNYKYSEEHIKQYILF